MRRKLQSRAVVGAVGVVVLAAIAAGCSTEPADAPTSSPSAGYRTSGDGPTFSSAAELAAASTDVVSGRFVGEASREDDNGGVSGAPTLTIQFLRFEVQQLLGATDNRGPSGEILISWTMDSGAQPLQVGEEVVLFVERADSARYPGIDTQKAWYMPVSATDAVWDLNGTVATPRGDNVTGIDKGAQQAAGTVSADLETLERVVQQTMAAQGQ